MQPNSLAEVLVISQFADFASGCEQIPMKNLNNVAAIV
jgi:hypothetical protein